MTGGITDNRPRKPRPPRQLLTRGPFRVIREDAGAYGTMSGPLTILGFDDPEDPNSVYLEYQGGGEWVDDQGDIEKFNLMFADIAAQALPSAESAALIEARVRELEGR